MLEATFEQHYRERTTAQRAMAGIMSPAFRCVRCKKNAPTRGRQLRIKGHPAGGYLCATCHQARSARATATAQPEE
jgi:hypothetical protein